MVQLEQDRRAFQRGAATYVAANLVLAALVWIQPTGSAFGWILSAIAFLANVFYTLMTDWEMKWASLWRREVPRLERELGDREILSPILAQKDLREMTRRLRLLSMILSTVWLIALLVAIANTGVDFRIAR